MGELLEREQISNSPLWILGNDVDGWFIAVGRQRLSGVYKSKEECRNSLEDDFWNIIGNYMLLLVEMREESKNIDKTVAESEIIN